LGGHITTVYNSDGTIIAIEIDIAIFRKIESNRYREFLQQV